MAGAAGVDAFLSALTCAVCQELFQDPVILECGHPFCRACIKEAWGKDRAGTCPTCRKEHPERQLTANIALANLVEKAKEPLPAKERDAARSETKCEQHQENIRLFCGDCGELCCVVCRDALKHLEHTFLPVADAANEFKKLIEVITRLLELNRTLFQIKTSDQEKKIEHHRVNNLHLAHHITTEFEKLHKFLNAREKTLLRALQEQGEAFKSEMEKNRDKLKDRVQRIEAAIATNEARMELEDSIAFLTDIKSFLAKRSKVQQEFVSFTHEVISRELCRGQFKGPIQYAAWKEMKLHIKPVAACLTLDPRTANPKLILSEDKTQARYRSRSQWLLSNNPERFSNQLIALACIGFTSGKHYWEVEVGDKPQWIIGVAKETVDRKQITEPSLKDGYWAILRANKERYMVLDKPYRPLPLNCTPKMIGVYLDYEGGQISFYNSGDMSHLCTFTDTFNTRLFPYYSPGFNDSDDNAEPIKLLQPRI